MFVLSSQLACSWKSSNLEPENYFLTEYFSCNQEEKCEQTSIWPCIVKDTQPWSSKVDKDCSSLFTSPLWSSNQGLPVLFWHKVLLWGYYLHVYCLHYQKLPPLPAMVQPQSHWIGCMVFFQACSAIALQASECSFSLFFNFYLVFLVFCIQVGSKPSCVVWCFLQ